LPLIPIIDSGEQLIQPIHIDDFVDATMQLVSLDKQGTKQIAMPGPVAISMKELYQELNGWLGKSKAYFISIPYRLALAGAKLVGRISHTPVSVDTIRMLKQGNTADVKLFINEFGFTPKSVSEFLNLQSATQADRWYAGLYFLNPLLRLAIAFLWIFTGIVSAFIYPVEKSYQMLAQVGISMFWQPILLYTASILNILLGMATLLSYRLVLLGSIQLLVITIYTIVISLYLPGFWSHPFGPLSKNVPVVVLILIMMVLNSPRIKQ
jgi:hypothetical protein